MPDSSQSEIVSLNCDGFFAPPPTFLCLYDLIKAGVRLKHVFPPRNLGLMPISRSRFKHSQNPLFIPQSYV